MADSFLTADKADRHALAKLEERVAEDLLFLQLPAASWVTPRRDDSGDELLDVAIIGGGMAGLTVAAALIFAGIDRIAVFDKSPAGLEGPWVTFARMETLRTAKEAAGPALGVPSLTFRAWFTACFGARAWDELSFIPRAMWMDYLIWYRRILRLPVLNGIELTGLDPSDDQSVRLTFRSGDGTKNVSARRVVLATGLGGLGGPAIPEFIRNIDRRFWLHAAHERDFATFRGLDVGIVGAGASAMDNAAEALEKGARRVHIFVRRKEMPHVDKFTAISHEGLKLGFSGLPDEWKWKILRYGMAEQIPPPRHSVERVLRHENVFLHTGSPILSAHESEGHLAVQTPKCVHHLDRLVLATGFEVDLSLRPEFDAIADKILTWDDILPSQRDGAFDRSLLSTPYLDEGLAFQEKKPGTCPGLKLLYCYNFQAVLNHGKITSGVSGLSEASGRLVRALSRSFLNEMRDELYSRLIAYDTSELADLDWPAPPE
ncbi:FAD/NAD(P)-binding protein [Pseudochelatococcus contaminans]|uniref:FAD-dependent urate hydroxylase HpyO/Asp monooxygenase CreE-like FAD/NAD(P)-binding domain-containing protein n=1 Tax=Pseudochelatococcus contaminans TaxID=1538103 RepID=A0A7W6EHM7_9HYPH|nr:NAD(P)/FAD-dependent oxidoreductase [Pseudochelatococcus contaminans]MBB3810260.1 hypothetical protein [Pseudochelatococcus contaminans]